MELQWQFAQVAANGLEVERAAADGSWRPLGLATRGASAFELTFEDERPDAGATNTYRLRDPSTRWTGGQVSIEVPGPVVFELVRLTPNPATPAAAVTLRVPSTAGVELQVSDSGEGVCSRGRGAQQALESRAFVGLSLACWSRAFTG